MTLARSRVDLPPEQLGYHDAGSGELPVFGHGLLVDGDHWRFVVSRPTDAHRCVVPADRPAVLTEGIRALVSARRDPAMAGLAAAVTVYLPARTVTDHPDTTV